MTNPPLFIALVMLILAGLITLWLIGSRLLDRSSADDNRADLDVEPKSSGSSLHDARDLVIDRTSRLVERGDRGGVGLKQRLERGGSQLRSGEWVLIVAACTIAPSVLVYFIGGPIAVAILAPCIPVVAHLLLKRQVTNRQDAFADQLPDLLQSLSSALRSGQSLPQSIATIAPDLDAPAGEELRRVVIENRIGRDLTDSFSDLAERMGSKDFEWVVRAMDINRRTGGDLSVILRRLDATIRARNQVAGTVRSLSAEGKISAVLLGALTPVLALAVQMLNPTFLEVLVDTLQGRVLIGFAILLEIVGVIWLYRLTRFRY